MSGGAFDASGMLAHGELPASLQEATVAAVLVAIQDPQSELVFIVEIDALQPGSGS